MNNILLTIVLPTYNHPDSIDFCLKKLNFLQEKNIYLAIHDSSTNDDTKKLVESYNNPNILYYRYPSEMDVDFKVFTAMKKVTTKYSFLCGDGAVLKKDICDKINDLMSKDSYIIEMYDTAINRHIDYYNSMTNDDYILYKDVVKHFSDNYWHMPYYGGSIIKSEIFINTELDEIKDVMGGGFMYPFTIYKYCSKVSDFSSYVIGGDSIALNPYKSDSIWLKKKWGPKIWIDNFSLAVNHLPSVYDAEKKNVLKTFGSRSTFFTFKGLLNWRAEDNYNRKIYKQYGSKIMDMSYLSKSKLKLILLVPKFMLKALRKVLKERKKKKLLDN